mmetsp:Transcript_25629/g.83030  ORF Transcript_25629/g.83030 Transcript_25629/m.83030 type:complete len:266 (+) Transcript_25629:1562-2359(+)
MDEVPHSRAFFEIYEGAIYLHQGKSYLITKLDLQRKTATAEPQPACGYRTDVKELTSVEPTRRLATTSDGVVSTGHVKVRTEIPRYKRISRLNGEVLSVHPLKLPTLELDSRGTWIDAPPEAAEALRRRGLSLEASIHAANHAILAVAPLFVLGCDVHDVQSDHAKERPPEEEPQQARLVVYDARPAGVGAADAIFRRIDAILAQALDLLEGCPCRAHGGCPSCVYSPVCSSSNQLLDKLGAAIILRALIRRRREREENPPPSQP